MGKIIAIVFLVIFAWFAVPRLAQAQWFAPTLYPSYWWGAPAYNYQPAVHNRGWGWFNFSLWGGQPSFHGGYTPGWGGGWSTQVLPYNGGWSQWDTATPYYIS